MAPEHPKKCNKLIQRHARMPSNPDRSSSDVDSGPQGPAGSLFIQEPVLIIANLPPEHSQVLEQALHVVVHIARLVLVAARGVSVVLVLIVVRGFVGEGVLLITVVLARFLVVIAFHAAAGRAGAAAADGHDR